MEILYKLAEKMSITIHKQEREMAMTIVIGNDMPEVEAPLLDDGAVVGGSVDFKGRPASRSKTGCWKSASFIIGVGVADRFAYYGIRTNLISYLSGPMGQSTAAAAANVNAWTGVTMILPLLGAFVADSCLGKYRTITIASLLYILGIGLLSGSAAFRSFNYDNCKNDANLGCSPPLLEVMAFFIALYLVSFGLGGYRPCVQAFGADQFDEDNKIECKAKSTFFNWWYFAMNGGILVAYLVLSYIQENFSWALGFGIPCILMCFALILFVLGSTTYRFPINNDKRNPFVRIGQVFVKSARNWQVAPTGISMEEEAQRIMPDEGAKFKFLDRAILATGGSKEDENCCSTGDIEDAKAILRLVPIWSSSLGYAIVSAQAATLFTKQGTTMDRYIVHGLQIPAASLQSIISLSVIVSIPIYDRVLVPIARAITKNPIGISMLQRIGTGLVLSLLAMVVAALVERQRLAMAVEYGLVDMPKAMIPMSVWWLAPQYLLVGIGEVFAIVGLQEFFYDQIPSELKSIGVALYLSIFGIGNFLSSFLISVIEKVTTRLGHGDSWLSNNLNRAHLDYFYWLLAGLSAVYMVVYVYFAKYYIYRSRSNI